MSNETTWILLGLLAAISAAGVAIFGKLAVGGGDVASATLLRSLIMSGVLAAVVVLRGSPFRPADDGHALTWLWIILAGVCGAVSWLAYFAALNHGPTSGVAVVDRSSLVFTFILAMLFLVERPSGQSWLGLALVVAGMVLVATARIDASSP